MGGGSVQDLSAYMEVLHTFPRHAFLTPHAFAGILFVSEECPSRNKAKLCPNQLSGLEDALGSEFPGP